MNVLLCSTYELGHQPLALAQPAAHLVAAGFDVRCRDLAVESLERNEVDWADLVGISVPMHTAIRLGVRLGREIKSVKPDAHLCFFGLYASLNARYLLEQCADSVVGGEFERPLVELADRMARAENGEVPGVQVHGGPAVTPHLGRQRFLPPARHLLPALDRYCWLERGDERTLTGYVEASRGCAHTCLHCPIPAVYEGRVRIVQEDVVVEDVTQLVQMGARHIDFGDPDFLNGVKHSLRVARRVHERFPAVTFNFTTKIEHIVEHREAVRELARLGCIFITSAVESLSDVVLRNLEKGHTEADVRAAKEIVDEVGIALRPTLVAFTPWTGIDDYLHVLDVVEELDLIDNIAPVQYTIRLLIPPGSCLLGRSQTDAHLGAFNQELFTYEWQHPDRRMDDLCRRVDALVREAGQRDEDPFETFHRVRDLALTVAGRPARSRAVTARPTARRPTPRLSEPWFC